MAKRISSLNIEELEAYIAEMQAEVDAAGCSPCAMNRLGSSIKSAKRRITQLRRDEAVAAAQGQ